MARAKSGHDILLSLDRYGRKDLELLPDLVTRRTRTGAVAQWLLLAVVLLWLASLFIGNPNLDMGVIGTFLFSPIILDGLFNTLIIAICAQLLAMVLGVIVGYGRLSSRSAPRVTSWLFVWFFRSTPLIVQLLIWGNLSLFIPRLGFGEWSASTNDVMSPFVASVIALGIHDAAYLAEIVRSGVQSVSAGQKEAASALGLTWWQAQRRVVLPQALRVMIPAAGSFFVLLLKSTSLVVVIAGGDLLTQAQNISAYNFKVIELLLVATIWFLVITTLSSVGQSFLERRFSRQLRPRRERQPEVMRALSKTDDGAQPQAKDKE